MKRNLILFRVDNFLSGLWPLSAVAVIYFQQITNSYTLAMLVFSIINIVQTLFEVPTGVLSDKIGRKKTIILSNLLILSGYILWALAGIKNMHYLLYLGSFLVGSGNALLSGTDDAMVFETLKDMDKEDEFDKFFSKNRSYNELGIAIGATIATFVYFYYPINALAFLAIFPPLLQVIISFLYIEPKNTTRPDNSFLLHLIKAIKLLLKNKNLFKFALIKSLNDSLNAVNWRFIGAYYEQVIAPWMINIVRIFQEIMGYISYTLVPFIRKKTPRQVLFLSVFINALIKFLGALINTAFSPFIMASSTLLYGISTTFENNLLQQQFSDEQRATMGSLIALSTSLLNVIIFLSVGYIADISGARISVFVIMLARMLVAVLYKRVLR